MWVTVIPITLTTLGTVAKGLQKRLGIGNQRKNRDHQVQSIFIIGLNTQ